MSGKIRYCCHFCGRSNSLHHLEKLDTYLCTKCWEIIALVASKWYAAGAQILAPDYAEAEERFYKGLLKVNDNSEESNVAD